MKQTIINWILCFVFLFISIVSFADGKFYFYEEIPVSLPYQGALIVFNGKEEILTIQSRYKLDSHKEDNHELGWIVPVPSVPEITSMKEIDALELFFQLSRLTGPIVLSISELLLLFFFFASIISLLTGIVLFIISLIIRIMKKIWKMEFFAFFLLFGAIGILVFAFFMGMTAKAGTNGVDIIKAEQVGVYDIKVITSNKSEDLINWLGENGFSYTMLDVETFNTYLQKNWYFVVAKASTIKKEKEMSYITGGLTEPLILRFQTDKAIYPLALTGTAKNKAEILLYVQCKNKLDLKNRLPLKYAKQIKQKDRSLRFLEEVYHPERLYDFDFDLPYIMKYKTTDYKETPLHFAILEGYEEIVELLIEHKADINCQDEYNNTPLHKAAIEN